MKRDYLTLGLISLALVACGGGENGLDGKDGKDGGSCTITNNEDGTATITCPDGSSFTVKNGEDGKKGDAGSDGEKGQHGQSCKLVENVDGSQAVVCPADGTSYIVRGNTDNYANYCAPGFYGKNCENECHDCGEHGNCNDGVTGDGSCICEKNRNGLNCDKCADGYATENCILSTCKNGTPNLGLQGDGHCSLCNDQWEGTDCDICPKGFYDGVNNCVDCRKGSAYFGTEKCTFTDKRTSPATIYQVVTIGDQTWMAENMRYPTGNSYHADNSESNDSEYGLLYNWETAKIVCPSGWRLPEMVDFENLLTYVTDNKSSGSTSNFLALIAKSTAWTSFSNQGTDEFGFGALPAGKLELSDIYDYMHFAVYGYFWMSEDTGSSNTYYMCLGCNNYFDMSSKDFGNSVRCLKGSN